MSVSTFKKAALSRKEKFEAIGTVVSGLYMLRSEAEDRKLDAVGDFFDEALTSSIHVGQSLLKQYAPDDDTGAFDNTSTTLPTTEDCIRIELKRLCESIDKKIKNKNDKNIGM